MMSETAPLLTPSDYDSDYSQYSPCTPDGSGYIIDVYDDDDQSYVSNMSNASYNEHSRLLDGYASDSELQCSERIASMLRGPFRCRHERVVNIPHQPMHPPYYRYRIEAIPSFTIISIITILISLTSPVNATPFILSLTIYFAILMFGMCNDTEENHFVDRRITLIILYFSTINVSVLAIYFLHHRA